MGGWSACCTRELLLLERWQHIAEILDRPNANDVDAALPADAPPYFESGLLEQVANSFSIRSSLHELDRA